MPTKLRIVGLGLVLQFAQVHCQCTFGATFASTTWHDNTKGTLTFTATGMTGWAFRATRTGGSSVISSWSCVNHTSTHLILRTTNTFSFQPSSSSSNFNVYAYMCMELSAVTSNSYMYYQKNVQEINLGGERLKVSMLPTLYLDDVCESSVTVPTREYHVLVMSGSESGAAIQCPDSLLFVADFTYYASDGTASCGGTGDRWDVCANKSQMAITTSSCTQEIAFSAGGNFFCVATLQSGGYDYTTVYNRDTSITTSTNRFACLSVSGHSISVAPGNCTAYQTPFSVPLAADQLTGVGHRLVLQSIYESCGPSSSGLTVGEIVAIVISVLFIIYVWTLTVIFCIIVFLIALICCQVGIVCVVEFTSFGDHIPRIKQPNASVKLDIPDAEKNKLIATLQNVAVTSPSDIIINGKANGQFHVEKETAKDNPVIHGKDKQNAENYIKSPGRKKLD